MRRRVLGCAVALSLALALAPAPAASAPPRSARAAQPGVVAKLKARGSAKRKSTRAARKPVAPALALPTLPQMDVGALAALTIGGPGAAPGPAPVAMAPAPPRPFAAFSRSATSMLDALTERARSQLGTRYVLGAASPGGALDCSSFTRFAMEALGLRLPRTAAQQAKVGVAVPRDRSRLRPDDLLTFGRGRTVSHVGIYLGDDRFIHASVTSGRVIETTFAKNAQLFRRWLGARRLLAGADSAGGVAGS